MMIRNENGATTTGAVWAVVVLAIAIVVIAILWQRDQESKDLEIDVGRALPSAVHFA